MKEHWSRIGRLEDWRRIGTGIQEYERRFKRGAEEERRRSGGAGDVEREARRRDARSDGGNGEAVRQDQEQAEASMRPTEAGASTPVAAEPDGRSGRLRRTRVREEEEADSGVVE